MKGNSFARRDHLRDVEVRIQSKWEQANLFQVEDKYDKDGNPKPKFMVTFPYPYMNGRLHLVNIYFAAKNLES